MCNGYALLIHVLDFIPDICETYQKHKGHAKLSTAFCSYSKWNDGLHGADVDRYKAEIILINFALGNNF